MTTKELFDEYKRRNPDPFMLAMEGARKLKADPSMFRLLALLFEGGVVIEPALEPYGMNILALLATAYTLGEDLKAIRIELESQQPTN